MIMAIVARVRRDEADGAVEVVFVVPACEGFDPCLSISFCGKTLGRPIRAVFAGSEQRLGKGVVVADARATVGCDDAQIFHRGALHALPGSACTCMHERGAGIVRVQDQRARDAALGQDRLSDQLCCQA